MLLVSPSMMKRMSAPAGDFASGSSGSIVAFIIPSSSLLEIGFNKDALPDAELMRGTSNYSWL
jgi:hypothetical protein